MPHELLRSKLKLPDHLAGGPNRRIASEALKALNTMTPDEVRTLFTEHELNCLPQWAQEGIAFALRRPG
ncbi:MAG: hypothetical protein ABIP08_02435 [Lautropia sp.]